MAVYVGKSGKTSVSSLYIGKGNSVKKVVAGYHSTGKNKFYEYITPPGQQIFTSSGWFTVPSGVKSIDVFLVGGGGGGGNIKYYTGDGASGGGAGYTRTTKGLSVTPGQRHSIIIGDGGAEGYDGGYTKALITANGGIAGSWDCTASDCPWSSGGSGGGMNANRTFYGGSGGYDGTNGYYVTSVLNTGGIILEPYKGGNLKGQGTTTRAFGESTGTLYAGGGGGGSHTIHSASGGAGGGGRGAGTDWTYTGYKSSTSGDPNTGGGGGGAASSRNYEVPGGSGGSGIVIIRWGY